mmetsp:Transcript_16221/g.41085  ORF Transcript_16221/g.41085 Transcript_16221/m.41085 type:complete len:119 (-) Transcript_16221:958-1314(-)
MFPYINCAPIFFFLLLFSDSETVTLFCMCSLTALMVDEKKKSVHCMEILDYIYDLLESTVDEFPTTVRQLKQKTEAQWKRNIRTALRYHPGVFRIELVLFCFLVFPFARDPFYAHYCS